MVIHDGLREIFKVLWYVRSSPGIQGQRKAKIRQLVPFPEGFKLQSDAGPLNPKPLLQELDILFNEGQNYCFK